MATKADLNTLFGNRFPDANEAWDRIAAAIAAYHTGVFPNDPWEAANITADDVADYLAQELLTLVKTHERRSDVAVVTALSNLKETF